MLYFDLCFLCCGILFDVQVQMKCNVCCHAVHTPPAVGEEAVLVKHLSWLSASQLWVFGGNSYIQLRHGSVALIEA